MELFRTEKNGQSGLSITGDMTIYKAHALIAELKPLMETEGDIRLDLSDARSCDTPMIQVLYSAWKTARHSGKRLLISEVPLRIKEKTKRLGLKSADIFSS